MKRFQPVVDCQTTVTSLCSSDYIQMEGRKAGESSVPPSIAENSQRVRANGISSPRNLCQSNANRALYTLESGNCLCNATMHG